MQTTQAIPWVEKYRPKLLDDVVGNVDIINTLKCLRDSKQFPNLLLCGPPGIGKTTSVHCLARELLGNKYNDAVLELNASDERGIDIIRGNIKTFCEKKIELPDKLSKIIVLDEADSMTSAAFQALRRTMEIHSKTTVFVFACNSPEKIIEPIQSRCTRLAFRPLQAKELTERIRKISTAEQVQISDDAINAIEIVSEGDLRKAINALQTCSVTRQLITPEDVYQRNDLPSANVVMATINYCLQHDYDSALQEIDKVQRLGFDANDVIDMIVKMVSKVTLDEQKRVILYETVSEFLIHRVNSNVQLYGLLAKICLLK
ncbi:Replication factor C subunit [Entamoeba marina]